jgi:PAS domain S-box-containing protein
VGSQCAEILAIRMTERRVNVASIGLASFVREAGDEIVEEWTARTRAASVGAAQSAPVAPFVDDLPVVLGQIASLADEIANRAPAEGYFETARRRARERLRDGVDISVVVSAFSLLRASVWTVWQRHHGAPALNELQPVDLAIDAAIAAAVTQSEELKQQTLESALGKLESLLAASPIGIAFLDRDLRYLRINEALASMNGRSVAEHIGRTVTEVLPAYAPAVEQMLRGVIERGTPLLDVAIVVAGDRALRANFFPVRARSGAVIGVGGVVLDVTERRRVEQALEREQLRIQSILEHSPAAIWIKDPQGRIVLANHKLAETLGRPYAQLIGVTSADVLGEAAAEHEAHDRIVAVEQRAIEVEEVVPSPDGDRTFLAVKFPIPGEPPMVGAIATEITQRKQMENALRSAVGARDTLLAVVSHDLRNPLSAIQVSAGALAVQVAGEGRARRHLDVIERSCKRMTHLIDDLVDMASLAAGQLALDLQRERAADVTREAVELHRALADEKGIALDFSCSVGDATIACDRDRVLQVFANLVGNALKFCRVGDTIAIDCALVDGMVRFTVSDTGPGIGAEALERIFEPYWSGSPAKGGAGLGLFISRGIIERQGGQLDVESAPGRGTRFSFTLPLGR